MVYYYEINFVKNGVSERVLKHLTDCYKATSKDALSGSLTFSINALSVNSTYELEIYAVDIWGTKSEKQVVRVTTATADDSSLPTPYVDINMENGSVTDSRAGVTLENKGAFIINTAVTHKGKTYLKDVISITASKQHILATFKGSATSITRKFMGGATFEAFFVNSAPTDGINAVMCAWESGGWGVAVRNGKLFFQVYTGSNSGKYSSVTSADALPTNELTHVIAVFDVRCRVMRTYINGVLAGTMDFIGEYVAGSGDVATHFAIGADISAKLNTTSQSSGLTVVDLKIYDNVFTSAQAKLAYNVAVSELSK